MSSMRTFSRRSALITTAAVMAAARVSSASDRIIDPADWQAVHRAASGQTVYFNAWGGSPAINAYIAWVAQTVDERFGVELKHVRVGDIAEAIARLVAERTGGRDQGGSIDLLWVNGENFHALKRQDLLFGPFAEALPHFRYVDTVGKPTTLIDFSIPTDGLESPWGMAQLVMLYDSAELTSPPTTLADFSAWIEANPGRFTFPAPPDFLGSTFLKQVLLLTLDERAPLDVAVDPNTAGDVTAPLWAWLDRIRPAMWRDGQAFPTGNQQLHQMLDDGDVSMSFSFNPGEASQLIAAGRLPETVRTFAFDEGTLGNTHFVAIPYNATAVEGAMVVADFLLSPEAQAQKAHPEIWGDPTVLDVAALGADDRALFEALPLGPATLPPAERSTVLLEPHPTWTPWLEDAFQRWAQR